MIKPFQQDVFKPVLFSSPALAVTSEQLGYINRAIDIATSDSKFAEKLKGAIAYILTAGNTASPAITSLSPNSAVLGSPNFTLHVRGTGFTSTDKIYWNGSEEPTTFVSATELTTEVNMGTAEVAMAIPVNVVAANGVVSNDSTFTLTSPARSTEPIVPPTSKLPAMGKAPEPTPAHKLPVPTQSHDPIRSDEKK